MDGNQPGVGAGGRRRQHVLRRVRSLKISTRTASEQSRFVFKMAFS